MFRSVSRPIQSPFRALTRSLCTPIPAPAPKLDSPDNIRSYAQRAVKLKTRDNQLLCGWMCITSKDDCSDPIKEQLANSYEEALAKAAGKQTLIKALNSVTRDAYPKQLADSELLASHPGLKYELNTEAQWAEVYAKTISERNSGIAQWSIPMVLLGGVYGTGMLWFPNIGKRIIPNDSKVHVRDTLIWYAVFATALAGIHTYQSLDEIDKEKKIIISDQSILFFGPLYAGLCMLMGWGRNLYTHNWRPSLAL